MEVNLYFPMNIVVDNQIYWDLADNCLKLRLHDAIYRLRFYSNSLIHILSLSKLSNNVASIQKNRDDKSHRVIVALVTHSRFRVIVEHFVKTSEIKYIKIAKIWFVKF